MTTETVVVIAFGLLSAAQSGLIFTKSRKDKRNEVTKLAEDSRVARIETDLAVHIKEDLDMHERVQKSETKIEGLQQQVNDVNSRHGELVSRIDEIHKNMLTKDDLKLLVEVIRLP